MATQSIAQTLVVLDDITIRQDNEGRFCINDLHRAAGGADKDRPNHWLALEATKKLIAVLDEEVKIAGIPAIQSKQGLGTFACLEMVYDYAAWISPEFKLKVYRTFHAVVSGQPVGEAPTPALPGHVEDMLRGCRVVADMFVDFLGVDRGMALAKAMAVADTKLGTSFQSEFRALLPSALDFREPTQIDQLLGLTKVGRMSATNLLLQDAGFQTRDHTGAWVPTNLSTESKQWVRKPYNKNGHSGVSLLWEVGLVRGLLDISPKAA